MKKIVIASDHAGKVVKDFIVQNCKDAQWEDLGPSDTKSVDYPDFAAAVCKKIQSGQADLGVLICGSGIGMSIAANKFKGIRAAHVESTFTAQLAGEHNRANVLCIGERISAPHYAVEMVKAWLHAEFGGAGATEEAKGRHQRRIDKIKALEDC